MAAMTIKLVRHAESEQNAGLVPAVEMADHLIPLTDRGREQAKDIGRRIGSDFVNDALVYVSPYRRTRDTLQAIFEGSGGRARVYEDPRLREVEHGYDDVASQDDLRRIHGWFYYRFRGGESPADCYDRASGFLESMMRQAERKQCARVLIVTHGLLLRCFVMRFLRLSVEQFDDLANPDNGAVVTLGPPTPTSLFTSGRWGVEGLELRRT